MTDIILKRVLGTNGSSGIPLAQAGSSLYKNNSDDDLVPSKAHTNSASPLSSVKMRNGRSSDPASGSANDSSVTATAVTPSAKATKGERLLKAPKEMSNEDILAQIEAQAAAAVALAPEVESNVVKAVYVSLIYIFMTHSSRSTFWAKSVRMGRSPLPAILNSNSLHCSPAFKAKKVNIIGKPERKLSSKSVAY